MSETPPFIGAAERFAVEHGRCLAFRLLGLFIRSDGPELEKVVKKIYCGSIPENTYAVPESLLKTHLGALLLPLGWLGRKALLWKPAPPADFCLEVPDSAYFEAHLKGLFERLSGRGLAAPMTGGPVPGIESTEPVQSSVRLRDCLRLILMAPLLLPSLWALRLLSGVSAFQAFRQALSIYAVYRGFFSRHPCRRFITVHDDTNHPCRDIAFKQSGGRELIVIQNGERNLHPQFAFGRMDRYFVFGKAHERLLRAIGVSAASFSHVGAFLLDARWQDLSGTAGPKLHDILFIDQCLYPFIGLSERSSRSIEAILCNLARLKSARPELRVACQLKPYAGPGERAAKEAVLSLLKKTFGNDIAVLENDGKGAAYRNILRSELVMTFESGLGFEALRLGVKALFVNYSGDPAETMCEDERFQLEDDAADYGRFESKVLGLLSLKLDAIPEAALERNAVVDGRFAERVAGAINAG